MRMHHGGLFGLALALGACGGEAAPAAATTEPATTAAPEATTERIGSRASRETELDLSLPEFQGDHSLPGDPVAGEAVYRANCLACHAANGTGNGGMTGADFVHDRARLARNNEVLLRSIREGVPSSPPMPPHGEILDDQQMRDALSYIRATFGTPDPS